MISFSAPDLTQHPPRSPRVRLGGYIMLPRSIDKARAKIAGKLGEYLFPHTMDEWLLEFLGTDGDAFLEAIKTDKSDSEMLAWIKENVPPPAHRLGNRRLVALARKSHPWQRQAPHHDRRMDREKRTRA